MCIFNFDVCICRKGQRGSEELKIISATIVTKHFISHLRNYKLEIFARLESEISSLHPTLLRPQRSIKLPEYAQRYLNYGRDLRIILFIILLTLKYKII